jgi:leader peptidase (prepilin peptidase) / N-methyltransferase
MKLSHVTRRHGSIRDMYPMIALAACALVAWRFGAAPQLPAYLALALGGTALAAVDRATLRLPDALLAALALIGGLNLALVGPAAAVRGLAGAAAYGGCLLAVALARPAALGLGDVKLAAVLGFHLAWLSWSALLLAALAGHILAAAYALARRLGRDEAFPLGPHLLAGALVGIVAG